MRPGRAAWTRDDDALLLGMLRRRTNIGMMAELLSRSERAVYNRLSRKRLIRKQTKRSGMTDEQFWANRRRMCLVPR